MEVFIDAGRGESGPAIVTQSNIVKVIRDSIQVNFGECGLAACFGSLQGTNSSWNLSWTQVGLQLARLIKSSHNFQWSMSIR